ncbi:MAG: hypothetical protein ACRDT6_23310 [Micromonosporaceae bacterium]
MVSPDGAYLVAYRQGKPAIAPVDALMKKDRGTVRELDIDATVTSVSWGGESVYLQAGDAYWRCPLDNGSCTSLTIPDQGGVPPKRLVVRFGLETPQS